MIGSRMARTIEQHHAPPITRIIAGSSHRQNTPRRRSSAWVSRRAARSSICSSLAARLPARHQVHQQRRKRARFAQRTRQARTLAHPFDRALDGLRHHHVGHPRARRNPEARTSSRHPPPLTRIASVLAKREVLTGANQRSQPGHAAAARRASAALAAGRRSAMWVVAANPRIISSMKGQAARRKPLSRSGRG